MIDAETLISLFRYNVTLIDKQLSSMTHAQSMRIVGGYNINWLLGHLVSSRHSLLERIGDAPIWSPDERAPYRYGSVPQEKDGAGVLRLDTLRDLYHQSQTRLEAGLRAMTPEQLAAPTGFVPGERVDDRLLYLQYHEGHHIGQIVLIAQVLGEAGVWLR